MSKLIDKCRIAVVGVIQNSDLPVGSYIDSEKIVRAVIKEIGEEFSKSQNSSFGYVGDELLAELRESA